MNVQRKVVRGALAAALVAAAATVVAPAFAHHSFAIFDAEVTRVFTGVVTRVNPDANHLQIFFAPMNAERSGVERDPAGKPITWAVEMAGSAQAAKDGISVSTFPPGTYLSVALHPLRSGEPAGSRANGGAMFKCPEKVRPAPGKHCDSLEGSVKFGDGDLPQPTVE
ncbi:MAG TPA: DUF6152 family protein [Gammaproteobacteria bacterium]|nr:DUF6152 family protein [Gammaproteobacteria bacterium]